jgi:hypothetical protein
MITEPAKETVRYFKLLDPKLNYRWSPELGLEIQGTLWWLESWFDLEAFFEKYGDLIVEGEQW